MRSNVAVQVGRYPAGVRLILRRARVRQAGASVSFNVAEEKVLVAGAHEGTSVAAGEACAAWNAGVLVCLLAPGTPGAAVGQCSYKFLSLSNCHSSHQKWHQRPNISPNKASAPKPVNYEMGFRKGEWILGLSKANTLKS